jgi:hypothetical protein
VTNRNAIDYALIAAVIGTILWGGYGLVCALAGNPFYPFG